MPYIRPERRLEIEAANHGAELEEYGAGDLNYEITKAIDCYLQGEPLSYSNINEVIGVLECAKLELYRRVAAPYETQKMIENGDVYDVLA